MEKEIIVKKCYAISVCLLLVLVFSTVALSKIVLFSLPEMVGKAETIAIGKVVEIKKADVQSELQPFYKATISVERLLKGNQFEQRIDVYFFSGLEDEAHYSLKDKSIFFIYKYQGRNRLVQGIAGKVDITGNQVVQIYMLNEKRNQEAANFIKKIERTVHR